MNLVADASFGVFFVHSYVLTLGKILTQRTFSTFPEGSLWAYMLLQLLLYLFVWLSFTLLRRYLATEAGFLSEADTKKSCSIFELVGKSDSVFSNSHYAIRTR